MPAIPTNKKRILETILGLALIAVGVWISVTPSARGDMLVIFFVGLGGFFVSKSLIIDFFKSVWPGAQNRD